MRRLSMGLCLLLLASGGCGMSDGQRYKLASNTYQATANSLVAASKAGILGLADMERIEPVEFEVRVTLAAMRLSLAEGKRLDFEWYHNHVQGLLARMIEMEMKAAETTKPKEAKP